MNYILEPVLEHMALTKIAFTLWKLDDIRALVMKFPLPLPYFIKEVFQDIDDKVIKKVLQLPQPELFKEKILCFIKPVRLQMLIWMDYHRGYLKLGIDLPDEICWTPQGTIDKKKTAEILIKDENLDVTIRYQLACIYCLEDNILQLWNKIPEDCRKSFYSEEDPSGVRQNELVVLWTYDIKGEMARMNNMLERRLQHSCSPYRYAFEHAAKAGNKAATEYFLQKLTPSERKESLVESAICVAKIRSINVDIYYRIPRKCRADVLYFLLSQMDAEQQIEVFKTSAYEVFNSLLDYPWQRVLIKMINVIWDFLTEINYYNLLETIVNKVKDGYYDCIYQKLFGEFWQRSPDAYKKCVINTCASRGHLLSDLFEVKDKENISLILEDVATAEKEKIIFCHETVCERLVYNYEWDLLKFFISECIDSQETMIKFKEKFEEYVAERYSNSVTQIFENSKVGYARYKDRWDKFFQLLDDFICGYNKRKNVEESDSSPVKRLCNIEFKEA